MASFQVDYSFGIQKEDEVQEIVEKFFNDKLTKHDTRYSKYDFKGSQYFYELKSRKNEYLKYPTTMVQASKIFCDKQRFLFYFTDGLFYIEYNKELFDTFEIKNFQRFGRVDFRDFKQKYIFIPIDKLIKIA
jgi:hypothetical protein